MINVERSIIQKETSSIRDIVVDARLRKVLALNFLATGLGIALILALVYS